MYEELFGSARDSSFEKARIMLTTPCVAKFNPVHFMIAHRRSGRGTSSWQRKKLSG